MSSTSGCPPSPTAWGNKSVLVVKHLPRGLSAEEQEELLVYFGASKAMGGKGRHRDTAFAHFGREEDAEYALNRLHQLRIMGSVLVVEYAREKRDQDEVKELDARKGVPMVPSQVRACERKVSAFNSLALGLPHISPHLKYRYPPPTPATLANISQAIATVPKLYTQVLHLMNRMGLPPPFAMDSGPPLPQSEEESEMESSGEEMPHELVPRPALTRKRPLDSREEVKKRLRLQKVAPVVAPGPKVAVEEAFEVAAAPPVTKAITLKVGGAKIGLDEGGEVEEGGGFGLFSPPEDEASRKEKEAGGKDGDSSQLPSAKGQFLSLSDLAHNRISKREMGQLPVFSKYNPGEPTSRLYIKNLARLVEEKDLTEVFGGFVRWDSEEERNMFDVRVMQEGRMKGQAFVNLPSVEQASRALQEANGFMLKGKPMVVHYARSAPPKAADKSAKPSANAPS